MRGEALPKGFDYFQEQELARKCWECRDKLYCKKVWFEMTLVEYLLQVSHHAFGTRAVLYVSAAQTGLPLSGAVSGWHSLFCFQNIIRHSPDVGELHFG